MSNESSSVSGGSIAVGTFDDETEYRTINLLGFVQTVWRRKKTIFAFSLGGLIIAAVAAYTISPAYDATVRFLPPETKEISPLSLLPSKNQGDHYLGLVSSRTVQDDVIEHQHLKEYFHAKNASEARRELSSLSKIVVDKDQFVTVTVRAREPQTAVNIANEYLNALYRLSNQIAVSEAKHRWEFYEVPLEEEKNKLADAEEALKKAEQETGVVLPEAQVRLGLNAIANLKQQIASEEAQLASLLTGGTEQNPQVIRLRSEISNLYGQVDRLQQKTGGQGATSSSGQLPALALEVERRTREVKFHETLFQILSRQYENARVDQSYTPSIQLVDRPVLPDEKSWPRRKVMMILGLFGGGLVGLLWVLMQAAELSRRCKALLQG
jgi:uncharacterized protein involved in exopolysaccharide biosynthesis